jgi:hypothetical protein
MTLWVLDSLRCGISGPGTDFGDIDVENGVAFHLGAGGLVTGGFVNCPLAECPPITEAKAASYAHSVGALACSHRISRLHRHYSRSR